MVTTYLNITFRRAGLRRDAPSTLVQNVTQMGRSAHRPAQIRQIGADVGQTCPYLGRFWPRVFEFRPRLVCPTGQ